MNYEVAKVLGYLAGSAFLATFVLFSIRHSKYNMLKSTKKAVAFWMTAFFLYFVILLSLEPFVDWLGKFEIPISSYLRLPKGHLLAIWQVFFWLLLLDVFAVTYWLSYCKRANQISDTEIRLETLLIITSSIAFSLTYFFKYFYVLKLPIVNSVTVFLILLTMLVGLNFCIPYSLMKKKRLSSTVGLVTFVLLLFIPLVF